MRKLLGPLVSSGLLLAAAVPAHGAAVRGEIEIGPQSMRDAVIIPKVTVEGNEVQFRQNGPPEGPGELPVAPFGAAVGWPLRTEIHLFNRTNKVIVAGRVDLAFLRTGAEEGPPMAEMSSHLIPIVHLDFGVIPQVDYLTNGQPFPHRAGERLVVLPPGQEFVLRVGDYADNVNRALAGFGPTHAPTRIFIIPDYFYFDDGMRWGFNAYAAPDPAHPGQWIYQDPLYFPGNRNNHWPIPGHTWTPLPERKR